VVSARKGRATFRVRVEGRGAHAGGGHERGANAIVQLASVVTRLAALTDHSCELTVNVGRIEGGTVNNRVPHEASATLEMRAFDMSVFGQTERAILAMNGEGDVRSEEDGHACRISVAVEDHTQPWMANAGSEYLAALWKSTGQRHGIRVAQEKRGGLSDGNVLWHNYYTLDGLGPRGENSHCSERSADGSKEQEWVDAASFVPKAVLNALAIEKLLQSR